LKKVEGYQAQSDVHERRNGQKGAKNGSSRLGFCYQQKYVFFRL
jgi:hypothetical protein